MLGLPAPRPRTVTRGAWRAGGEVKSRNPEILSSRGGSAARRQRVTSVLRHRAASNQDAILLFFISNFSAFVLLFFFLHPPFPSPKSQPSGRRAAGGMAAGISVLRASHPAARPAPYLHQRGGGGCIPARRRRLAVPCRAVPTGGPRRRGERRARPSSEGTPSWHGPAPPFPAPRNAKC